MNSCDVVTTLRRRDVSRLVPEMHDEYLREVVQDIARAFVDKVGLDALRQWLAAKDNTDVTLAITMEEVPGRPT